MTFSGTPDAIVELFAIIGEHIIELSKLEYWNWSQIDAVTRMELQDHDLDESVFLIGKGKVQF